MENENKLECKRALRTKSEKNHWHDSHEIAYIHSGNMRARLADGEYLYNISDGDIVVFRSCDVHCLEVLSSKADITVIHIPSAYTALVAGKVFYSSFVIASSTAQSEEFTGGNIEKLFESICNEYQKCYKDSDKVLLSGISLLSLLLMRLYPLRRKLSSHNRIVLSTTESGFFPYKRETMEKFGKITDYIDENFASSHISLRELSERFGLNLTHISDLFPKLTGMGFRNYLAVLRVNKALELLCTTNMNISETAFACGFETIRSFNNVFKEKMNMTPSEFLSSLRAATDGRAPDIVSGTGPDCISGFYSNDLMSPERCSIPEADIDGYCIAIRCTDYSKIKFTALHTHIVFRKNAEYNIRFYYKPLGTTRDFNILLNFHYAEGNSPAHGHAILVNPLKEFGDWKYYEASLGVKDTYLPSIYDRITIYTDPVDEKGVGFAVADLRISCK